ncbi:LPXTG-motif cell wall anchor domain-containing protein [Agreia bicolorata]|uniref:LPXTG-motif cell wall anchor domain-containing protein n=1 Tax=Agreia bicolorata TaxID=110935 RepID=A0A1T4XIZ0_9MICO|nr:LPXTG cell wall anchor domain-containing protein [Agreia bicolorata]SKA89118.1 LPXTG-motif cell wall anchor domain-containing protein [Agreia bicolorata]
MSRSILSRLGAGLVATALVAGGSLLMAAPASAAGEPNTITVANTAFQSGAGWGEGIKVAGTDFPATTEITVAAGVGNGQSGDGWGSTTVTTDANGAFSTTLIPENGPTNVREGFTASVVASYPDPDPLAEEGARIFSNAVELQIADFVPAPFTTTIDPICISGVDAATTGVNVSATGFGQFEEGVVYTLTDAAGTQIGDAEPVNIDETGSVAGTLTLQTTLDGVPSGPIADGVYTITFTGSVTTAGLVTVGNCDAPVTPAEVVPAAPQLANTGSSDAGILVGGSALLLLVGAALMVARRRQNAAA